MKTSRGFTLIEVMVGAAVALVVIGIITSTFLVQQKSLQGLDLSREASNASRDAMLSMQGAIGRAGYGIDPRYAFDFRNYNCTSYSGATTATNACRDHVLDSDELVFVERDPNYYWAGTPVSVVQGCDDSSPTTTCTGHAWQVTGFSTSSPYTVTVKAHQPGETFLVGQEVEITCRNGGNPTLAEVGVFAKSATAGELLTLTLVDPVLNNHYKRGPAVRDTDDIQVGHDACFDTAGVTLFLVNRYRYFVKTVNGDPWLMLDRGLDFNNNGKTPENSQDDADLIPIAHGVEGLQVAYLLRPSTTGLAALDSDANWIIGDAPGTLEEANPFAAAPLQFTADTDASRFDLHPANIRGVRVRLTVRSLQTDRSMGPTWVGDAPVPAPATAIENRNDFTAVTVGRYRRYFTSVAVATPNLNSKDPFVF